MLRANSRIECTEISEKLRHHRVHLSSEVATRVTRNEEAHGMADDLTVTREGDTLVIRLSIQAPTPSASGKTLVVASTRGNQKTSLRVEGKDLYLGVNAYVYAVPKEPK
jgi:hypothetical protein